MTTRKIHLLSVVVPCHNEEAALPELHRRVMECVASQVGGVELIVVDDGSADSTARVAATLVHHDPRVRMVSFSRNFGKEAAMLAGLREARGDAVVIMDADLQHPPELLPRLVEAYSQGVDQVVARRTREGDPVVRTALSKAYYRLVNGLMDVPLRDGAGDFRLLSRRAVDAVLSLSEANRFSKGLFAWIGFPAAEVEYNNAQRTGGRSSWTMGSLVNYGVDGIVSFNNRPLRMSVWLGMASVCVGVLYVLWLFVQYVRDGITMPGYLTIIASIVFFGGVQLVFLGVIGEYVGRIYYETKRRPHYIVAGHLQNPAVHSVHPAPPTQAAGNPTGWPGIHENASTSAQVTLPVPPPSNPAPSLAPPRAPSSPRGVPGPSAHADLPSVVRATDTTR